MCRAGLTLMTPAPSPVKHHDPSRLQTQALILFVCSSAVVSSAPVLESQRRTAPSAPPKNGNGLKVPRASKGVTVN